jgi:signal peptidase II
MSNSQSNHKTRPTENNPPIFQRSSLPDMRAHLLFWPIVIAGAIFDLWSKTAVFDFLSTQPAAEYDIINGFLRFVMRENSGAAFSIARGQTFMLVSVSIVALIAVTGVFLFGKIKQRIMQIALAMFTAGIIGNLYDRITNEGFVRDFIDVYCRDYHWPAFNVADSLLCISVGILIITTITSESSEKSPHQQKEEHPSPN